MGTRHRQGVRDHLIEIVPRSQLRRRRREEARAGRVVIDGFGLDGGEWLPEQGVTCVGIISDDQSAAAALLAACRGAALVTAVTLEGPARHRLLEDLGKVGRIVADPPPPSAAAVAADRRSDEGALIEHLAAGASVAEAARRAGMSQRTAHRRLAALRAQLGVTNTAELVVRARGSEIGPDIVTAPHVAPTLVSRERELARVVANLATRQPTAIIGEAGIGKTSLARAAAARRGSPCHEGGALVSIRWAPFLPLTRAIGVLPTGADSAAVAHRVIDVVGDGTLLLDDLQWADSATLGLVHSLATSVAMVVTVRTNDARAERALDVLGAAGFDSVRLEGLHRASAHELLRVAQPGLPDDRVEDVLDRANGNPFLLLELAQGTSDTLRSSLLARIDPLGPPARDALARLALLGRPADRRVLGPGVEALLDSGLAVAIGDQVALRHDLIATEAIALIGDEQRRRIHLDLAEQLTAGEAARHYAAGGDRPRARGAARAAAETAGFPGERARHLLLAAGCTDCVRAGCEGCQDLDVALAAVDAFLEAGELDEATQTIDRIVDVGRRADIELRRARARWQAGDPEGAKAAVEAGLALAAGSRTATEVGLRIEELRHPIRVTFDGARAMSLATETWALARQVGVDEARARVLLGSAHLVAGSAGWAEHIGGALTQAQDDGDLDTAFEASNALVAAHLLGGDRKVALAVAGDAADLARRHHRRHWEEQFAITANLLALLEGRSREVAEWGREFVRPHLTVAAHLAHAVHAVALADLGLGREATATLREGRRLDAGDETGTSLLYWAEAETHWLLGQPERAACAAAECLRHGVQHFPVRPLAGALQAWAQFDLGGQPIPVDPEGWDFAHAAALESRGVAALAQSDHIAARSLFEEAACLATDAPRFALRARWGAAEALRRTDRVMEARDELLAIETAATTRGFLPLAGRVRRSLRELGHHPDERERSETSLTRRQCEVLSLVADGHTSSETAAILGLQVSTVDAHIKTAMERLGASTRRQAALLVREQQLRGG